MRQLCTGLLAAALVLGLLAVEPAQAKVYKMAPEERAAALKEKKAQRAKSKKTGKAVPGQDQSGWVEVKPGDKIAKKNRKAKVDELAKAAEDKGKKSKKSKKDAPEAPVKSAKAAKADKPVKAEKTEKIDKADKADKKAKKSKKTGTEEIVVEKKGAKAQAEKKPGETGKKSGRKSATHGDRAVGSNYTGSKVSASSNEVRRPGGAPASAGQADKADDLSSYSVSRPGQDKAPAVPEVRQEVQPGPVDASKPVGTEHKAGEGRF